MAGIARSLGRRRRRQFADVERQAIADRRLDPDA
jgi:hypothetical protein